MSNFITTNVPLAPSASTTQVVLPDWYTNYARQILSNQQAASNQGYQAFNGPRVAQFNGQQQAGFNQTNQAAQAYQPGLQAATQAYQSTIGAAPGDAGLSYLDRAGQSTATTVNDFMNPYSQQVAERLGDLGARTLQEKLLPAIGDQFISSGGYGGSRQAEAIGKSVRDASESITAEQAAVLERGYGQALSAAQNEASRQGALAQTAAGLAGQNLAASREGAAGLAGLASQAQELGLKGASAVTAVGDQQQAGAQKSLDTAYADYLRQQGFQQEQIDNMVKTFGGVLPGIPKATMQEGYAPFTGQQQPGTSTSQNIASIIGALGSIFG